MDCTRVANGKRRDEMRRQVKASHKAERKAKWIESRKCDDLFGKQAEEPAEHVDNVTENSVEPIQNVADVNVVCAPVECAPEPEKRKKLKCARDTYLRLVSYGFDGRVVLVRYADRFEQLSETELIHFNPANVPFHRVRQFALENGELLWDREAHVDRITEVFCDTSANESA